jgi:energy-coupling factor transport system permease protein
VTVDAVASPRREATHWFTRSNPVARIGSSALLSLPNLFVLDAVTAGITLGVTLAVVPAFGLPRRTVARTLGLVAFVAGSAVVANALAGDGSWGRAGLAGLRVAALVLPGALAFLTIDPVDLADSLVHQLRVPVRFAYGVLAAVRLTPGLAREWHVLARAERARGLTGRGAGGLVRRWARRSVALLVSAVRRATRVATALDARGFDSAGLGAAGDSPWSRSDSVLLAAAAGVGLCALVAGRLVT